MNKQKYSQKIFAVLTVLISLSICFTIAEYFLGWQQHQIASSSKLDAGLMRYHPQLGWALVPFWQGRHYHYDFDVRYSIDARGQRNGELTSTKKPTSLPTIALVGDSFTFGFGVEDNQTFHALLNKRDTHKHYLNMGIPGFSTDQQYLMIQQLDASSKADHYVLLFYLGNDLLDNALPFPLQAPRAKPYFTAVEGQLKRQHNPVPNQAKPARLRSMTMNSVVFGKDLSYKNTLFDKLIASSNIMSRLFPSTVNHSKAEIDNILSRRLLEHEKLLHVLLSNIKSTAEKTGSSLTIALLPGQSYVVTPDSYSAYFQGYVKRSVSAMSAELGLSVIDVAGKLASRYERTRLWFHPNEGHFTAEGHKQVAEILYEHFRDE